MEVRRGHPLGSILGALAREPHCERVLLRGLEGDEVAELIEAVAGAAPSAEVAASVHDLTEGNPFFVQEMARLLQPEGEGAPRATPVDLDGLGKFLGDVDRLMQVLGPSEKTPDPDKER